MASDETGGPVHRKVPLRSVRIGNRVRPYAGDLKPLMASLRELGLLQPIVIDQHYQLLAGFRRLTAAGLLGWETIDAVIVKVGDSQTRVLIELDENLTRIDFSPDELDRGLKRLRRHGKKGVFWNAVNWLLD